MKHFLTLILIFQTYHGYSQCVNPVITNFECGLPNQTILGNGITSIPNSFAEGINMSNNIGEFIDDGTNAWDNLLFEFVEEIDLTQNPVLSFKLFSQNSIQVLAKLEGGTSQEVWSDFSAENTWQEFNYDFSNAINNGNDKLVLFFNAAQTSGTTNDIYYIDDLRFTNFFNTYPEISDFESLNPSGTFTGNIQTVSNLFYNEQNSSTNIGKYLDDGTNGWDNLLVEFNEEINLSQNPIFSFKLYSPSSIQILVKLEGGTSVELWSDFSIENTWQEFNYDFSDAVNEGNTKIVLFFNASQVNGSETDIYYIDDLKWTSSLSINEHILNSWISSFPNPVINEINIQSSINVDSYKLFDIRGKQILQRNNVNKNQFRFNISELNSGLYLLKVFSAEKSSSIKILKR